MSADLLPLSAAELAELDAKAMEALHEEALCAADDERFFDNRVTVGFLDAADPLTVRRLVEQVRVAERLVVLFSDHCLGRGTRQEEELRPELRAQLLAIRARAEGES